MNGPFDVIVVDLEALSVSADDETDELLLEEALVESEEVGGDDDSLWRWTFSHCTTRAVPEIGARCECATI